MSHQNCDRCGARYRDEHTCEDIAENERRDAELTELRERVAALEAQVATFGLLGMAEAIRARSIEDCRECGAAQETPEPGPFLCPRCA